MANKIETSPKNIKPKMNLNHNIYNHFILNLMLETYEKLWYFLFFLDKYNNQQKVGLLVQLLFLTFFKYLSSGVITELVYETSVTIICFKKNNVLLILWLVFSHNASYIPFGTIMPSRPHLLELEKEQAITPRTLCPTFWMVCGFLIIPELFTSKCS